MHLLLIALAIVLIPQDVFAAKRLRFDQNLRSSRERISQHTASPDQISRQLQLEEGTELKVVECSMNVPGNKICKYEEMYGGRKIFGAMVKIEHQADVDRNIILAGNIYSNIAADIIWQSDCSVSDKRAAEIIRSHFSMPKDFKVERMNPNRIFIDEEGQARLAKEVGLQAFADNDFQRKMGIVDMCTEKILMAVNSSGSVRHSESETSSGQAVAKSGTLDSCCCFPRYPDNVNLPGTLCDVRHRGGNPNVNFEVGIPPFCLHPMRRSANLTYCYMENEHVRVVDLMENYNYFKTDVVSFPCDQRYNDETRGGYSPSADALIYATRTSQMYEYWYDNRVLRDRSVYNKVRFGNGLNNAFYSGAFGVLLGSGDGYAFYPWNGLDTITHELTHGVIESSSDLIYQGQSGGINEALCDMAGEAAEEFVYGKADLLMAADLFVQKGFTLRYFDDPTKDGISIRDVNKYFDGMDVHFSSGIYNRVFWLMVQQLGVRDAFECFERANRMYWVPTTTFESGACDTLKATYDLGYDIDVVAESFRDVGITFSECPNFEDLVTGTLMDQHTKSNIIVTDKKRPLYRVEVPYYAKKMTVVVPNDVRIEVSRSYMRSAPIQAFGLGRLITDAMRRTSLYVRFVRDAPPMGDVDPICASVHFD